MESIKRKTSGKYNQQFFANMIKQRSNKKKDMTFR